MENNNGKVKLEHRLTSVEKDVEHIKRQVSNDIPHQIKTVDGKVDALTKAFNGFRLKNEKWINRILVGIVMLLLATIINFIK